MIESVRFVTILIILTYIVILWYRVKRIEGSANYEMQIAKLELEPGDFLAISFREPVSCAEAVKVQERLNEILPEGVKAIIFKEDVELTVIRETSLSRRSPLMSLGDPWGLEVKLDEQPEPD